MTGKTWRRVLRALQQTKFYWQRLRGERLTKSLAIGVAVFALVVQSFALIQPDTAQAAVSDPNDNIIYQGAANKAELIAIYDTGRDSAGHADIKQIYSAMGITREDLLNATEGTYYTDDFNGQIKTLGRMDWKQANRQPLSIPGASTPIYTGGFLEGYNAKHYPMKALIGKRTVDGQWFAITLDCGNIVYVTPPVVPVKKISVCRPGTGVINIREDERQAGDVAVDSELCKPKPVTPIVTPAEKEVMICRPGTGVMTIKESQRQSGDVEPTSELCKVKPVVVMPIESDITVCRPGTGIITIKEGQRQSTDRSSRDAACQPQPAAPAAPVVTEPIRELPKTGSGEVALGALGLSLLAAASYFYWDSRRLLGGGRL